MSLGNVGEVEVSKEEKRDEVYGKSLIEVLFPGGFGTFIVWLLVFVVGYGFVLWFFLRNSLRELMESRAFLPAISSQIFLRSLFLAFVLYGTKVFVGNLRKAMQDLEANEIVKNVFVIKFVGGEKSKKPFEPELSEEKSRWREAFYRRIESKKFFLTISILSVAVYLFVVAILHLFGYIDWDVLVKNYFARYGVERPVGVSDLLYRSILNVGRFDLYVFAVVVIFFCMIPLTVIALEYQWVHPYEFSGTEKWLQEARKDFKLKEVKALRTFGRPPLLAKIVWERSGEMRKWGTRFALLVDRILRFWTRFVLWTRVKFFGEEGKEVSFVEIDPKPYHPDRVCGLSSIVNTLYSGQIFVAVAIGIISPEVFGLFAPKVYGGGIKIVTELGMSFVVGMVILTVLGICVAAGFGYLTYQLHKILSSVKEEELNSLGKLYSEMVNTYKNFIEKTEKEKQQVEWETVETVGREIERLKGLIEDVRAIPKWPISFKVSAISSTSPPITFSLITVARTILFGFG